MKDYAHLIADSCQDAKMIACPHAWERGWMRQATMNVCVYVCMYVCIYVCV